MKKILLLALSLNAHADKEVDMMLKDAVMKYNIPVVSEAYDNKTEWQSEYKPTEVVLRHKEPCKYGMDLLGGCHKKPEVKKSRPHVGTTALVTTHACNKGGKQTTCKIKI